LFHGQHNGDRRDKRYAATPNSTFGRILNPPVSNSLALCQHNIQPGLRVGADHASPTGLAFMVMVVTLLVASFLMTAVHGMKPGVVRGLTTGVILGIVARIASSGL
jgi:hypothetical protein